MLQARIAPVLLIQAHTLQPQRTPLQSAACGVSLVARPVRVRPKRDAFDAVDRTGCDTQVASGAQLGNDCMHAPVRPHDRINWTGLDALGASDTQIAYDTNAVSWRFLSAARVKREGRFSGLCSQCCDASRTAGRAAIDLSAFGDNGLCIGQTSAIPALSALGLRQQVIDCLDRDLNSRSKGRVHDGLGSGALALQADARMNSAICGQTTSRQRLPLKMP